MQTKPSSPWGTQGTATSPLGQGCSQHLAAGEQHLQPRAGVNCSRDPLGGQASSEPVQLQTSGQEFSSGMCAPGWGEHPGEGARVWL